MSCEPTGFGGRKLIALRTALRVLLLACLGAALAVLGSWLSGELGVSPSSRAPESQALEKEWLAGVQQGIAEREYRASRNGVGLQAPNRAHGLRTYFEASGIRVHDRTAAGSPELLSLSLTGLGRSESMEPVEPGEVVSDGARVEIRRASLVEWYANTPAGLEQGFTIDKRPGGDGALALELAVEGAQASRRGAGVMFETQTGRRLEYGKLAAVDTEGRVLVARLELPDASRLRLVVEDQGAAYPVLIDPLLTATADTQLEANQSAAHLGWSVAGAGDVNGDGYADVIVGANEYDAGQSEEGAAFVFLGSASGVADGDPSTAHAQLESNQENAELGYSVASAGDVNGDGYADVIVGAPLYESESAEINEGAAFVFLGSASGIADGNPSTAHAHLEANDDRWHLGESVAGAGDVNGDGYGDIIVGAPDYRGGRAFVFLGSASGVVGNDPDTAHATIYDNSDGYDIGRSVAGAGDVNGDGYADVIVGDPNYTGSYTYQGIALIFLGSASGIAGGGIDEAATRIDGDGSADYMGLSVAGAGDVNGDGYADVIVGAPGDESAVVFLGSASGIADGDQDDADALLHRSTGGSDLGWSVAGAGDVNGDGYADVIVGAPLYHAESPDGAAFVFPGSASGIADWDSDTAELMLALDPSHDFGCSVAGAGDVDGDGYADLIVGARYHYAGESSEGAAFVFLGSGLGIADGSPTTAATQLESDQAFSYLGWSVADAGDVNGDGYDDVIVGAREYDAGEQYEGAAFVFHGSAGGIGDASPSTAAAQLESDQPWAELGGSVAGAGDVNGDGYADVIVGARYYSAGQSEEGAAFVFLGSASGVADADPATSHAQLESNQASAWLGRSVAGAGDVNGDGYADVIVGADHYQAGENQEGAAFVFLGSASGIADGSPLSAAAQLESDQAGAYLGYSVAGAGDVNGDGYADVIVGADHYDAGEANEGAAFVFLGSASGIADGDPSTAHAQLESDQAHAYLGWSVSGAGDVNGDFYSDVIVGARYYDAGETNEGAAFVFLGSASGVADGDPGTAAAQLESDQAYAYLGGSVSKAGDVNGDGYSDVIVGAERYDAGLTDEGAAFLFLGSASGIADGDPTTADAQFESDKAWAALGGSVSGAGDVDGDGFSDVIVGAWYYEAGETDEGAALMFLGNGGGRGVAARQLRGDLSGQPVQPWGLSHQSDAFQVSLRASHPEIWGQVKLEVEYCEAGIAFGDPSCGSKTGSSWTDVTATSPEVVLVETIDGLTSGELYRWRARVLYAPYLVDGGFGAPPIPTHSPWRRLSSQAEEADVRVLGAGGAGPSGHALPCSDGVDNDGDGWVDLADGGCRNAGDITEEFDCSDGLDNDGDGRIDFDAATYASPGDETTPPAGDGDPGCGAPTWSTESPECQDGVDNEVSGERDYDAGLFSYGAADPAGPDPDCAGRPWWDSEAPWSSPCGLGFELVFLIAPLLWLFERRRDRTRA